MKVAIVHDWLVTYAGSERVLEQFLLVFPDADLYSIVDFLPGHEREFLRSRFVHTSFIQRLPFAKRGFRWYLNLMPLAVEQLDLSGYDLVLSSSHAVAKGVITGPDQLHVSYVHSPFRYAWDQQAQYLREHSLSRGPRSWVLRLLLHWLRIWDVRTAPGVDHFLANSRFVARRIRKVYRREARVIHPPVNTDAFQLQPDKKPYFLAASRLVPYKRVDLIVEAFSKMPERRLIVIGDGPERKRIESLAGSNVSILGYQPPETLQHHMGLASAFIFAAEEDFGILPVEAQACGTPVIAYGRGGILDSVVNLGKKDPTGILFTEQSIDSLIDAISVFEDHRDAFLPNVIRRNALRFGEERFRKEISDFVSKHYHEFKASFEDNR